MVLAARMVRESRGDVRATLDWGGVGLASLGLFLLIYPVVAGRGGGLAALVVRDAGVRVAPMLGVFIVAGASGGACPQRLR